MIYLRVLLIMSLTSAHSNYSSSNASVVFNEQDVTYSQGDKSFTNKFDSLTVHWMQRRILSSQQASSSEPESLHQQTSTGNELVNEEETIKRVDKETDHAKRPPEQQQPQSFTSLLTRSVSKFFGTSQPTIENRQMIADKIGMAQMKLMMAMNKKQMMLQTINNMMAMKMMTKMKMKKMKYDMKKKKMKMKMKMAEMKEKKKICKECNKCGGGGKAEPELVKIDRIKLKKVPMPVDSKSYKKMARSGKGAFKIASKSRKGYSFPKPIVNPEPEVLALPEPEVFTKKQLVTYDYQYKEYPSSGDDYYSGDYGMPNMTTMMMTMMTTTTTTAAPTMMTMPIVVPGSFVTFPPVNVNTGKRK